MSKLVDELFALAKRLDDIQIQAKSKNFETELFRLRDAANKIGEAWCGSWIGYQSKIYYEGLQPVPPGTHFSSEWGAYDRMPMGETQGEWCHYSFEQVRDEIFSHAGFTSLDEQAKTLRKAASHLETRERHLEAKQRIGTHVFIGHGRSFAWRDFKDFIQDRLSLPWDEFNRVPVAGITNIARLLQMLDDAAIAFIIMTAEDEHADGKIHARENVVHEAGLFQGRLGFTRAILVLEEGCEEFSNIQGLGQIRFPKGNIKAAFEEIRKVLEREGLI